MKIGVFDSGIGGKSVAVAINTAYPDLEVVFVNDSKRVPYGTRAPNEIYEFIEPIFQRLLDDGCQVIVVACNTVSTTLIGRLRTRFSVPLIALEPMVKTAASKTISGVITVCATPTTLASARYEWLKQTYAPDMNIIEPDCSQWSYLIEQNTMSEQIIRQGIEESLVAGADVIVLGCTHYHWIEDQIKGIVSDRAIILQPEQAIIARLGQVLAQLA